MFRRLVLAIPLTLVLAALGGVSGAAADTSSPLYLTTVGGPGHASIYASGVDVDANGSVYVADPGNDQVKKYGPKGALIWNVGVRGSKAAGNFDNPRDIAYLGGRLYVADLGYKRVQVLDAATGAPISMWGTSFPSTIGISAGVDANGNSIILVTEDVLNQVRIFTPSGSFIRTIGSGVNGSAPGELAAPRDAATDSAGNVYVADYANNRIAKFTPNGAWITAWGTEGGKNGQFRRPYGIDLDVQNNVWVADNTNHRIQEFTSSGTYIRQMGSNGSGPGQFFQIRRVAVMPGVVNPMVYGADLWGNKVERFTDVSGGYAYSKTYAGVPATDDKFNEATGVAVDAGNIFVADSVNQRMQRFGIDGAWQGHWGHRGWGVDLSGLNWPRDIAIERADPSKVWVTDTKNGRMLEFTRSGTPTGRFFGSQGFDPGQFRRVSAVASTATGVVVADTLNNRVQLWNTLGTPFLVWSVTGFSTPKDVAVKNGVVYVADTGHQRIVKLSVLDGSAVGTIGVGTLHATEGVAIDADGDVWAADTSSDRLVEFSAVGTVLRTFGSFGSGQGQFNAPGHLEVVAGRLYVCDMFNDRLEIFSLS
ncbi:MAG: tripartite motif-containing protein 71 [Gaiellales bacterium]|nr:tripartite motif-containing protein 71 [Gaiellales bacterium]